MIKFVDLVKTIFWDNSLIFMRCMALTFVLPFFKLKKFKYIIAVVGFITIIIIGWISYWVGIQLYGLALLSFGLPFLTYFTIIESFIYIFKKFIKKEKSSGEASKILLNDGRNCTYKIFLSLGILLNFFWLIVGVYSFTVVFSFDLPITIGQIIVIIIYFIGLTATNILFPQVLLFKGNQYVKSKILLLVTIVFWTIISLVFVLIFITSDIKFMNFIYEFNLEYFYLLFLSKIPTYGRGFMILGNVSNIIGSLFYIKKQEI